MYSAAWEAMVSKASISYTSVRRASPIIFIHLCWSEKAFFIDSGI